MHAAARRSQSHMNDDYLGSLPRISLLTDLFLYFVDFLLTGSVREHLHNS